jgi:hypothetical protein
MKIDAFILTGTSGIEVLNYAFSEAMGYEIASLLNKNHDLTTLDFTINFSNNNGTSGY